MEAEASLVVHVSPSIIDVNGLRNGGMAGYIYGLAWSQALLTTEITELLPDVDLADPVRSP